MYCDSSCLLVTWLVGWFVRLFVKILRSNISNTFGDRSSVPKDHQYHAYGESNGQVIEMPDGGLADVCAH